jgi:uncharacterized protein (TIGR02646 family)
MIQIPRPNLAATAVNSLTKLQSRVNSAADFTARVAEAKRLFSASNRPADRTFQAVKKLLDAMCSGVRRCMYCEDSAADEVEHHHPKNFYPDLCFAWPNYLYACGPCNGPKGNQFAVLASGKKRVDLRLDPVLGLTPPPAGDPLLLDPCQEDPLQFFKLDLVDTFCLRPQAALSKRNRERAEYTLDVLRLNRDLLLRARIDACADYIALVKAYAADKARGESQNELDKQNARLRKRAHPTVFREMARQRDKIPALQKLFAGVSELTVGL